MNGRAPSLSTALWTALWTALLANACVEPATVTCDDGSICPADLECSVHGCVAQAELDACAGVADGADCGPGGASGGTCLDEVCVLVVCGDLRVEDDEVCDDGNRVDGDGCAGDCRSREACGNGVRDVAEECDDGNDISGDGCQATCTLPVCGDGVVDVDRGEVCDDGNRAGGDGCADDCGSDESCGNGVRDLAEQCDDGNDVAGDGCQADCALPTCGDGVVDAGNLEVCDDGNQAGGDGCAADCRSDETCGNGLTDVAAGEQCDLGAGRSGDGCGSSCLPEGPAWTALAAADVPGIIYPSAAWMPSRGYAVVAGGATQIAGNDVTYADRSYVLDRGRVRQIYGEAPAPRLLGAMNYDEGLDAVLLCGGLTATPAAAMDTWAFDGQAWRELALADAPSARWYHAVAGGQGGVPLILFGGSNGAPLGDTWRFDGDTWTELTPAVAPPPRLAASMGYDRTSGLYVLTGGYDGASVLGDTWTFDGVTWSEQQPGGGAPTQLRGVMTEDPAGGLQLLLRGVAARYRWHAGAWTQLPDRPAAPEAGAGAMFVDARRGELVSFGGVTVVDGGNGGLASYEALGPGGWAPAAPADVGFPVTGVVGMGALDVGRGEVVMAAGATGTLVWDARAWRLVSGAAPTEDAAMAALPDDDVVIAYGNYADADTWAWRGAGWTRAALPSPDVYSPVMAYDPARHAIVLWGGADRASGARSNRTWLFDGAAWTELVTAHAPSGRARASMVHDPARARLVLFGGITFDGARPDDTWVLGADDDWHQLATAVAPQGRAWAGLGVDAARASVVLFGGNRNGAGPDLVDTWELIDETWREVSTAQRPARHALSVLVPHPHTGALLRLGGSGHLGDPVLVDPWRFGYGPLLPAISGAPPPAEDCDAVVVADADADGLLGCDDPDCAPRCYPYVDAAAAPVAGLAFCGDGTCDLPREDAGICAVDCDMCGDGVCVPALESAVACPLDCDACGDAVCGARETAASCAADCAG